MVHHPLFRRHVASLWTAGGRLESNRLRKEAWSADSNCPIRGRKGVSDRGKPNRHVSDEIKRQAVDEDVSGRKTAAEVCVALGVAQGLIYKWKVWADENPREGRIGE